MRSTLLHSSQRALRSRGHFEAYARELGPEALRAINRDLAPTWLPGGMALAHYRACHALRLPVSECLALGQGVSELAQGIVATVLLRLACEGGATPFVILANCQRLWSRTWMGSAVSVVRVGPKDVEIEILRNPCTSIPYFRTAFRGIMTGILSLVSRRVFCRESRVETDAAAFRVMWA